jgi:hypothetical protein
VVAIVVCVIFVVQSCRAIDVDPIAELTGLPEVCRVEGKSLTTVGPGNHALVGEAGRLAVVGDSRQNQWLLRPSECALQEFKRPSTTGSEYLELVALTNAAEILFAVIAGDRPVRYVLLDVSTGTMTVSRMPQPEEGTPNFPRVSRVTADGPPGSHVRILKTRSFRAARWENSRLNSHSGPVRASE